MKFTLSRSGTYCDNDEYRKELAELGFKFRDSVYRKHITSDFEPEIEFNTLEELMSFSERFGQLIITPTTIEIYDNYRE